MPPLGVPGKRKRGDRSYSNDDGGQRPSPYRPGNANLAHHGGWGGAPHHSGQDGYRGRGRGRGGRGGRGGMGSRGNDSHGGSFQHAPRGGHGMYSHHQQQQYQHQHQQSARPPSRPSSRQSPQPPSFKDEVQDQATPTPQPPSDQAVVQPGEIDENFGEPEGPIAPYFYDYVTDDVVAAWEEKGRETLLDGTKEVLISKDEIALNTIYLELLRSALDGRIHPSEVGRFVRDILNVEVDEEVEEEDDFGSHIPPTSAFLDTVSMLSDADKKSRRLAILLYRSEISPETMREELDSDLLVALNLVRPVFNKAFIRHQTNVLYRQSNYNLLREETEGYSKLLTELFTTTEDEMPADEVVNATFERVRSMIGTFDLDVGRTLDIILDVFAAVIVKHHRFFVKFLRVSSWWPEEALNSPEAPALPPWALPGSDGLDSLTDDEQSELKARRDARDAAFWEHARELNSQGKGILAYYRLRGSQLNLKDQLTLSANEEDQKWREITGTDPPVGNKVAAQILGFKLRYYSSKARDPSDELPVGLVHLTALLIKIGFISLRDIFPHLWPEDETMEEVRQQKAKEKADKDREALPGAGLNALALAGALSDDTVPATRPAREAEKPAQKAEPTADNAAEQAKEELPEPKDSKIELLKALLCIGAIPDALYIIGRFPWMLDLVLDLPEYIHRIIHHSLHKLYDPIRPMQDMPELRKPAKIVDPDQSGVSKGLLRRSDKVEKRSLRWLRLEQYKEEESVFYRYYWDDWNDSIPVCQTTDDLFTLCDTFLNLSGVKIGQDPLLLSKLIRIGAQSLKDDASERNRTRWIDLCKKLLVPALSLTRHNPGIMNEMYHNILKQLPIATRYSIYSEWYMGPTSRLPAVQTAFNLTRAETKDLLKRVSRNNVKQSARPLAKVSTSSPGITFQVAITQMENYQNLVECFVECARYLTDLGYDVLAWSTLNALGRQGRVKTSADGLFTSKWLQSLSSFCGRVYWRYKMLDPDPILLYLENQLAKGNPNDLKVLEEMVHSMGGISELTYNDSQILAMAGGPLLQSQALLTMLDKRHESRNTAERLRAALVRSKTISSFLIALAHEAQTRLYKVAAESNAPLKLQGNVHDEMFRLLSQYYEFLKTWLSSEQFERLIPDVTQLINIFGLEPRLAFMVSRAIISLQIEEHDSNKMEVPETSAKANEPGEESEKNEQSASETKEDVEMEDSQKTVESKTSAPISDSDVVPWHPVLKNIIEQTRETIGGQTLHLVGELFYVTFWQLSLNDMLVPTSSYEEEITRQKEKIREINQDRSDLTIWGTKKREEKRNTLNMFQDQLRGELKEQIAKYSSFTRNRMSKEKEHWFVHTWGKHDALNGALLEHCFIPRMVLSPLDAFYCFRMLKMLHSSGAKNFRTMGFLDQLFNQKRLSVLFYMCTSKEAENLARFINEILKDLSKWHVSKATYEKEAWGPKKDLPGFCLRIGSDKSQYQFLGYDEFRRLLFKWHGQLANAMRHCLEVNEYMHIRNAISVLRGVVLTFPIVDMQAKKLLEAVTMLSKSDPRDDIKLAASSLINMLSRRERNNEFIPLASFYQMTKNGVPVQPKPSEAVGDGTATSLNPEATSFKPGSSSLAIKLEKPEPEDGEINSPVVTDTPKQSANGSRTNQSSNLATAVESTTSADKPSSVRGDDTPNTGTPKPESRSDSRDSPAPNSGPTFRDQGRLANGRANTLRPPHALPARPDAAAVPQRRSDRNIPLRPDERPGREPRAARDNRDPYLSDSGRPARAGELSGGRGPDRLASERGFDRNTEKPMPSERDQSDYPRRRDIHSSRHAPPEERPGRGPPRDERPPRELRDRYNQDAGREPRERTMDDNGMPPPAPVMNPDRARLLQGQQAPGRDDGDGFNRYNRRPNSRPGSDRGSRAASPVRKDEREREARPSSRLDRQQSDHHHGARNYQDDQRTGGMRAEREPFIGHDDRSRGPPRSGPPSSEQYSSRSTRDHGPPPGESQYGRLNGPDPTPTGPRAVNGSQPPGRSSRGPGSYSSQGPPDRQQGDRPPLGGPGRHTRMSSGSLSRQPQSSSAPSTPGAPPDSPAPGVHPERAARLGVGNQPPGGPSSPVDAPRGPSNNAPGGSGRGSISNQNSPPSPVNERGRGDKRFAAINTTLQQSGGHPSRSDQGASIRGRGSRNPPPSPLGPGGPMGMGGPGRHEGGPPRGDDLRGPRGRGSGGGGGGGDLFADGNGPGPGSGNRGPRDPTDSRPPRRSGRSASPPGTRGAMRQGGGGPMDDNMRPGPARRHDGRELRARADPMTPTGPPERELRRGRGGDDFGSGKEYGSRHGSGGDRRDVRDISWGGGGGGGGAGMNERSDSRGGPGGMAPEGPGSGRKRRGDYEDHGDPKRNRRGR